MSDRYRTDTEEKFDDFVEGRDKNGARMMIIF